MMQNLPKSCLPILLICCNVGLQLVYTESPSSNISNHTVAGNDNETSNLQGALTNHGNNEKVSAYVYDKCIVKNILRLLSPNIHIQHLYRQIKITMPTKLTWCHGNGRNIGAL